MPCSWLTLFVMNANLMFVILKQMLRYTIFIRVHHITEISSIKKLKETNPEYFYILLIQLERLPDVSLSIKRMI